MKFANCEKIPVCPRGQATSLSGGPLPVKGGIVIDLSIMNDLLEIHEEDLIAIVSPGVLTSDIHKAAEQKDSCIHRIQAVLTFLRLLVI